MSNHLPATAESVSNLQYNISLTQVGEGTTALQGIPMTPVINFGFETGTDGTTINFDYSSFDQDSFESGLASALNSFATYWAGVLGVSQATVQDAISVQRVWTIAADVTTEPDAGGTVTETMTYPA